MRVLHMMMDSKGLFEKEFVQFIKAHNSLNNGIRHDFFFSTDKLKDVDNSCRNVNNRKSRSNKSNLLTLSFKMKNADLVVFHGFWYSIILTMFLNVFPGLPRKTIWIAWGADIYNYQMNAHPTFIQRVNEYLKLKYLEKIKGVATVIPQDFEVISHTLQTELVRYSFFYPNPVKFEFFDEVNCVTPSKTIPNILLGNSASETNEHRKIIDLLACFTTGFEFRVICPLSYGDPVYAEEIIKYGTERLGERFFPLRNLMAAKDYAVLLSTVDIAIFNYRRQQGLGNIIGLLYAGKKVYMRSEVSTSRWLTDIGVKVYPIEPVLISKDIDAFFELDAIGSASNKKIIGDYFSESNCIRLWDLIFKSGEIPDI